jgi:hypothetical protein
MMFPTMTYCRDADLTALRQRRRRGFGFVVFLATSFCLLGIQLSSF